MHACPPVIVAALSSTCVMRPRWPPVRHQDEHTRMSATLKAAQMCVQEYESEVHMLRAACDNLRGSLAGKESSAAAHLDQAARVRGGLTGGERPGGGGGGTRGPAVVSKGQETKPSAWASRIMRPSINPCSSSSQCSSCRPPRPPSGCLVRRRAAPKRAARLPGAAGGPARAERRAAGAAGGRGLGPRRPSRGRARPRRAAGRAAGPPRGPPGAARLGTGRLGGGAPRAAGGWVGCAGCKLASCWCMPWARGWGEGRGSGGGGGGR